MKQYEYKIVGKMLIDSGGTAELDSLGREGWRPVHFRDDVGQSYTGLFYRELEPATFMTNDEIAALARRT